MSLKATKIIAWGGANKMSETPGSFETINSDSKGVAQIIALYVRHFQRRFAFLICRRVPFALAHFILRYYICRFQRLLERSNNFGNRLTETLIILFS